MKKGKYKRAILFRGEWLLWRLSSSARSVAARTTETAARARTAKATARTAETTVGAVMRTHGGMMGRSGTEQTAEQRHANGRAGNSTDCFCGGPLIVGLCLRVCVVVLGIAV